jgi:putative NADH-flavin reductase
MHIALFAATGGIGKELLTQALAAGHRVTAVVRNPRGIEGVERVFVTDLSSPAPAVLAEALLGVDAVLSGLGPRGNADAGIAARGTRFIVRAMMEQGLRRVVVVSAAPVSFVASARRTHPPEHDPGDDFLMRYLLGPAIRFFLRDVYDDLAEMEELLRESGLEWTCVRPPRLTNGPLTAAYRSALDQNVLGGHSISRADVAHAMLSAVSQPTTIRHTLGIAS